MFGLLNRKLEPQGKLDRDRRSAFSSPFDMAGHGVLQIDPNSLDVLRLTPHCVRVSSSRVDFTTTLRRRPIVFIAHLSFELGQFAPEAAWFAPCSPLFRSCISLFRVVPVNSAGFTRVMKFTQALFAIVAISSVAGREGGATRNSPVRRRRRRIFRETAKLQAP